MVTGTAGGRPRGVAVTTCEFAWCEAGAVAYVVTRRAENALAACADHAARAEDRDGTVICP